MQLTHLAAAGFIPGLACALSRRAVECSFTTSAAKGDTCQSFASNWGLSVDGLQQLNPGITCPGLDTSKLYCVIGTVTDDGPGTTLTTTTSTTTTTRTTTTTSSAPTKSPIMPGIADNCDGFYKISSGDQCDTIAKAHGISTAQLRSWNSEINNSCSNLWLDYYICVHVPGATTTAPGTPEPTADPGSGPSPQLPGIINNCDGFFKVSSGDTCDSITKAHGISTTQFKSWNTGINDNCSNLWLGYYVCVHVPGATTTSPGAPAPTGDPSGPTPQLPGIVPNCKSFHLVESGDSCWSIYTEAGVTLAQLREWNTGLDAACSNLWLGYYVCVGV
ncbi:hypothetical protein BDV29DRAFT_186741 [Aspergillus leporis]|uniref:LysM domain-containing protein n=1 Tax=Aspergillus leporis TaxID=41062 RepID=A0A5N5WG02_9EURO|nr:hypothetical protein BDV29DRAFT_186741 [Aspergillus leporis]